MNLCFVTSECAPFAKTGGLADVSGALPIALSHIGIRPVVIMPLYERAPAGIEPSLLLEDTVSLATETIPFRLLESRLPDSSVTVWFVDCPAMFGRGTVYTSDPDEADRFIVLQRAALRSLERTGFEPDVIHANDWHAALLPSMVRATPGRRPATVLTVHNAAYQGQFNPQFAVRAGIPATHPFSFLRCGVEQADRIVAVSPTYAREITTPEFGHGLEDAFGERAHALTGILNGIDTHVWNPETDPLIPQTFTMNDMDGKSACRQTLLDQFRLDAGDAPLFGIVSRLAWQKGLDLLLPVLDSFLDRHEGAFVVLGSGDQALESGFRLVMERHPDRIAFTARYDETLAHGIEAGCDAFLMPSRYEPCGLNQMYSLRYGTLPLVRRTGGLADTVVDLSEDPDAANGFVFQRADPTEIEHALDGLMQTWAQTDVWKSMQRRGMKHDFSWDASAMQYKDLYREAIESVT